MPYYVMLSNKMNRSMLREMSHLIFFFAHGWASVHSWEVVSDCFGVVVCCFLSSSTSPLLIKQFLSCFCYSFPLPLLHCGLEGDASEQF